MVAIQSVANWLQQGCSACVIKIFKVVKRVSGVARWLQYNQSPTGYNKVAAPV